VAYKNDLRDSAVTESTFSKGDRAAAEAN